MGLVAAEEKTGRQIGRAGARRKRDFSAAAPVVFHQLVSMKTNKQTDRQIQPKKWMETEEKDEERNNNNNNKT